MSSILYLQEKSFNDISSLIKLFIKFVLCKRVGFVGDTNYAALRLDKIPNMSRTKSFIAKNGFALKVYFTQKFSGSLRIVNLSTGQQQSDELKVFSDKSMNFGGLTTALNSNRLIATTSTGGVLIHESKTSNQFQARSYYSYQRLRI